MEENKNMENQQQGQNGAQQQEKLFTQADVDRIVGERLSRVKDKQPDPKETELQQREQELYLKELVMDKKIPQDIADAFKGLDKEKIDSIIEKLGPYLQRLREPILNPTGRTGSGAGKGDPIREAMGL